MIREKTVFIVGAGASKEFGFPTGEELKSEIQKTATKKTEFLSGGSGHELDENNASEILRDCIYLKKCSGNQFSNKLNEFRELHSSLPILFQNLKGGDSIDNYLYSHSDKENIVETGKLCIALHIFLSEKKHHIENNGNGIEASWLGRLFSALSKNVKSEKSLENILQNVTFICFNYDRVIEHYLNNSIKTHFLINEDYPKIEDKIIHPYGTIAPLPWQSRDDSFAFGSSVTAADIVKYSKNIKTFTEQSINQDLKNKIKNEIKSAKNIMFIGFFYAEINLQLLECECNNVPQVYGTSVGLSDIDKEYIKNSILEKFKFSKEIDFTDENANKFIDKYSRKFQYQ
jgi:hypothetical protein